MTWRIRATERASVALLLALLAWAIAGQAHAAPLYAVRPCVSEIATHGHRAHDTDTALRVCTRVAVAAKRHGLPVDLLVSVARVESHFDPGAISPDRAVGPLQVLSRYHCARKVGMRWCSYDEAVKAGAAYLARLVSVYGARGGLARYRVGPGNYRGSSQWRAVGDDYAGRVLAGGVER